MARADEYTSEESQPLTGSATHSADDDKEDHPRPSTSSASTTSLVLEHVSAKTAKDYLYKDGPTSPLDIEDQLAWKRQQKPSDGKTRRIFYILSLIHI